MKTIKISLLFVAVLGLVVSCSKTDRDAGLPYNDLKGKTIGEMVVAVEPNGLDDTDNIRNAFAEAMSYGPGNVVQLVEGEYYISFLEIREFCGRFQGAGKGKTIITTVNDLDINSLISQNLNTVLVRFVGGDVFIGDMTIMTPPGALSTGSITYIDGLVAFSAKTYQYTSVDEYINAVINNVEFAGHWENTRTGLKAEYGHAGKVTIPGGIPLSDIDISITNSSFDGFNWYGALIMEIKEGKIIAGTKNNGNIFNNIRYYESLGMWHNVNVEISVEGNTFINPPGTYCGLQIHSSPYPAALAQAPQSKVTVCKIEQNVFDITGSRGLRLDDRRRYFYPDDLPMLVQVRNNRFRMSDGAVVGLACFNMNGMVIRNNKFSGSASYGSVYISGPSPFPYNENGLMLGNNISDAVGTAPNVILDARTRNWTIVGGNLAESVSDLGENNIITGMNVNYSETPFGQSIVDNLEEMREAIHAMKGN